MENTPHISIESEAIDIAVSLAPNNIYVISTP